MPRECETGGRLMEAATDLIWENSYGSTSVDAICEKAGVKKGSFYYFFESKSELAVAALEADWACAKRRFDAFFSPTVPPLERISNYFDFVVECQSQQHRECGSVLGCPLVSLGTEVSTQDPAIRAKVKDILSRYVKYFESAIRDAHAQGLISAPEAATKAKLLFAFFQGTMAQARIQNDLDSLRGLKRGAMELLGAERLPAAAR